MGATLGSIPPLLALQLDLLWQRHGRRRGHRHGEHRDGPWRAGVPEWGAGRWCDVFEIRDWKIQRCFIYLDPDYAAQDTARTRGSPARNTMPAPGGRMRIGRAVLVAASVLAGLWCVAPPVAAAAADHRPAGGWTSEQRWGPENDWEPNIAADPSSAWLYQMTTRYGGSAVCRPHMNHCIVFRSSADRGRTWHRSIVMNRRQCPPARACRRAAWQNDPVLAVSASGVIYAAWMNGWDVVFAKSRDHGRTWTGLHDFRRALGASFTDKPWIAISPGGQDVYVAFNRSDSFISASHDYQDVHGPGRCGRTRAAGTGSAEAGAVAPDGHVYFAESAEHQNAKGTVRLAVISSADGGASWTTTYPPPQPATTTVPGEGLPERLLRPADLAGRRRTAQEPSWPSTSQIPRPGRR